MTTSDGPVELSSKVFILLKESEERFLRKLFGRLGFSLHFAKTVERGRKMLSKRFCNVINSMSLHGRIIRNRSFARICCEKN